MKKFAWPLFNHSCKDSIQTQRFYRSQYTLLLPGYIWNKYWLQKQSYQNNMYYHISCCNMFVFACPIIARSQCWLFALRVNIRIGPQISIFVHEFNFWYLQLGLKENMSKYKERWCIKMCIKSYLNQINTFQNIGIKFK